MRIAHNVKRGGAHLFCKLARGVNQSTPDTDPPNIGLDKEPVQFRISVLSGQHSRKSHETVRYFSHQDLARFNLRRRQFDRIRMRQQCVSVVLIRQGCSPLQIFKRLPLVAEREANGNLLFHIKRPYTSRGNCVRAEGDALTR